MATFLENFKTIIGAESRYNDFIAKKNSFSDVLVHIYKVARFRIFIETNSPDITSYELSPTQISQEKFGLGRVLEGYKPLNSNFKKLLFGFGAAVSYVLKIPEFLAYLLTLALHTADDFLATRKHRVWQILRILTLPLLMISGLIKLVLSVASPLSNGMRLIKANHPSLAILVMMVSTLAIGVMFNFTGLTALALSATTIGAVILALGPIAAGVIFSALTILAFNLLTKSFSSGFARETTRNIKLVHSMEALLQEKNISQPKLVAKNMVAKLLAYEKNHNVHNFSRDKLEKEMREKINEVSPPDSLDLRNPENIIVNDLFSYLHPPSRANRIYTHLQPISSPSVSTLPSKTETVSQTNFSDSEEDNDSSKESQHQQLTDISVDSRPPNETKNSSQNNSSDLGDKDYASSHENCEKAEEILPFRLLSSSSFWGKVEQITQDLSLSESERSDTHDQSETSEPLPKVKTVDLGRPLNHQNGSEILNRDDNLQEKTESENEEDSDDFIITEELQDVDLSTPGSP